MGGGGGRACGEERDMISIRLSRRAAAAGEDGLGVCGPSSEKRGEVVREREREALP